MGKQCIRKSQPRFSTHSELPRSQQEDCGERKIFIDSGDSEDKEGCQRRHSAVQTLPGIVIEGSTASRKQGAQYGNSRFSRTATLCTYALKSRLKSARMKRIIMSILETTKGLTAHTHKHTNKQAEELSGCGSIRGKWYDYPVRVWWTERFTMKQTMKWQSFSSISGAACDSKGAMIKVKVSKRLSLMWQAAGMNYSMLNAEGNICARVRVQASFALSGTCTTDTFPRDTAQQQCCFVHQTELLSKTKPILWSCTFWNVSGATTVVKCKNERPELLFCVYSVYRSQLLVWQ